jgi:hypothetical protein
VPQNFAQAATWFRKAAEQGLPVAQTNLGVLYEEGRGVPHDYVLAATWYRKAAEQGNAEAQADLGFAYGKGHGVPQDYAEEYFWLDLGLSGQLPERADAEKVRNAAASLLTPAMLSRVQERARKWFEDHPAKMQ